MKRKILAIILTIVTCLSMNLYVFAATITDIQNQKSDIEDQKTQAEEELNSVQEEKSAALTEIEELTSQIAESQEKLDALNAEVKELEASIKKNEAELADAQKRQEEQQSALEQRILAQCKSGSLSYWDILLNPESPLQFISSIHMLNQIAKYDSDLLESIEQEKATIEEKQEELETQRAKVKTAKANAEKENVVLTNAKVQKSSKVAQLSSEEQELQEKIDDFQKQLTQMDAEIQRLAAAASSNNVSATYNGVLTFPCPSYTRFSSYFGTRTSPGGGVGSINHKGVDLAAPHGSSILAAESGTVITVSNTCTHDYPKTVSTKCSCGGGYGNYIMISHSGGLVTLYAHCATINVSQGQTVKAGQVIGTVGSTGYSTGNHLHFGTILNGTYVNPLPYIT
jgi:murein DD-endopeptidase MepM/ murein hydrolase activator NlpD